MIAARGRPKERGTRPTQKRRRPRRGGAGAYTAGSLGAQASSPGPKASPRCCCRGCCFSPFRFFQGRGVCTNTEYSASSSAASEAFYPWRVPLSTTKHGHDSRATEPIPVPPKYTHTKNICQLSQVRRGSAFHKFIQSLLFYTDKKNTHTNKETKRTVAKAKITKK